jgi:hypothetical protein
MVYFLTKYCWKIKKNPYKIFWKIKSLQNILEKKSLQNIVTKPYKILLQKKTCKEKG